MRKIILMFLVILLGSCKLNEKETNDNHFFYTNYEIENTNVNLNLMDFSEVKQNIEEKKEFKAIFVKNDCKSCRDMIMNYIEFAEEFGELEQLFFVNALDMSEEDKKFCKDNYELNVVPSTIIFRENGSYTVILGTISIDSFNDFFEF